MDRLLIQDVSFPSADTLSEYEVFSQITAMRHIVEPRLLRMESEIKSIGKASVNMRETLGRIEQQQRFLSDRLERDSVVDLDDDLTGYLQDVESSIHAHPQCINLAFDFAAQQLPRPPDEIVDRSVQRRFLSMQTAIFQDVDRAIDGRLQPISTALEDVKQQLARPPMEIEHLLHPDKLVVDRDESNAIPPFIDQEETVNASRAEHFQLQHVDLPNFQESLRNAFREEFQKHEVSLMQQLTELQNCGKPVMKQSAEGQNQTGSVMKCVAPIACISNAIGRSPEHDLRTKFTDSEATVQVIEAGRNSLASPRASPRVSSGKDRGTASPRVSRGKDRGTARSQKSAHSKISTFEKWFTDRRGSDKDLSDGTISLHHGSSFAGVFIQDTDLEKIPYRMEDHFKTIGWVQSLVRSKVFQNFTMLVVCVNGLWVGIAQSYNPEIKLYDSQPVFVIAETFFCFYFTMELALRFITFTCAREAFRDGWFRFDFGLVVIMILDTWVIMVIMQVMDGRAALIPIAPFRTLRLLKLTRMARLMHTFPELVTMIRSMIRSVRAVFSMCILVGLIVYVWGIIMHTLLRDEAQLNDRLFEQSQMDFSRLNSSMWILFVNGALLLDNTAPVLTQLVFGEKVIFKIAGVLFLIFVFLTAFLVLQMLTGIFCDVVIQVREEHRNEKDVGLIKQELTSMLKEIDDGDGNLTQAEVLEFISTGNTKAVLRQMGVNLIFLYQLQEIMFDRQRRIKMKDFLELMLVCRSSNQATVETLAGGFCFLSREIERLQTHLTQGFESTKIKDDIQDYAKKILVSGEFDESAFGV